MGIFVSFYEHFHDIKPVLVNVYLVKKHVLAKCDNEIIVSAIFFIVHLMIGLYGFML